MPILNIRDMGTVGVNSDIAPWELPPAAFNSGINFRMSNGKVQSAGGIDAVGSAIGDTIGHVTPTRPYNEEPSWIACGESGVYLWDGTTWVDKSGSLSFSGLESDMWSSCSIGNVTFLNHPDLYPIYWTNIGDNTGDFEALPWKAGTAETWASKGYSCQALCSHKNFLMALGMKEGIEEYRDKVWWSHPTEPNGIPPYWDITADQPDSLAGYVQLGKGGKIIGGESLRDSFIVYSEEAISALDYTGDALGWRRRTISSSADLVGREAVVEAKGQHFFIGRDDIMAFDGNSMQSIIHKRLKTRLASNVNNSRRHKSWAAHYESFNEIWFGIPLDAAEYPDVAYVYNYRDNTWGLRHLEKEFRHGAFGPAPISDPRSWDDMPGNFDDERGSWSLAGDSPFAGAMIGATDDTAFNLDPSLSTGSHFTERTATVIRRTDLPIGGHEANTTITRIYPLVEGSAPIQIRVGSAQKAGGEVRWASDYLTFTPGVDRKIDIRTTGETHAFEIKSEGQAFFDLTGMDIEFSMAGGR